MNKNKGKDTDEVFKNATKELSSSDDDEDDGRVPCPYCHKKFIRLAPHQRMCPLKPHDEEDLKNATKELSSSDDDDEDDGRVPCPYCHKKFIRLAPHQRRCPLKPPDEEDLKNATKELSSSDDDEDDGRVPCPYCHKKFIRLAPHQRWCPLKPPDEEDLKNATKELSSSDDDEDDGRVPCPYCHKKFIRLAPHQRKCPLKPHDEEDFKNATKELTSSDDDEDDGKVPCPYCHKKFMRLAPHQRWCPLKPPDEEDLKNATKELSSSDDDEDDGRVPCPYCHKKFIRLAPHQRWCPLKPPDEEDLKNATKELSSSDDDEDDGRVPCPYCHKKFIRLAPHQRKCPLKPHDEEDLKNATSELSSSDDDEDDGRVPCPYCHKKFIRLAPHQCRCPLKPHDEEDFKNATKELSSSDDDEDNGKVSCPYCHKKFMRLAPHQRKCPLKPPDEEDFIKATINQNVAALSSKPDEAKPVSHRIKECELSSPFKRCYQQKREHQVKFSNFVTSVQLKKVDIHETIKINELMKHILGKLNDCRPLYWMQVNSGSYYSKVKVSMPNEFDYMLCPNTVKCRIEPCCSHPCYCRVFITNKHKLPLEFQEILGPDDELTPSMFKEYVFKVFDLILTTNRRLARIKNESTSPAYTVEYEYGDRIVYVADIDWVPCLQVPELPDSCMEWQTRKLTEEEKMDGPIFVVPKKMTADGKELELWRLSYSTFEKKIIREKCKREDRTVIRVLKSILHDLKDDDSKLSSYHITTHCLHLFEKTVNRPELQDYTLLAIDSLICQLNLRNLPHFFIPKFNILQDVDVKERQRFIEKLQYYKQEWTDKSNKD